MEPQFHLFFSIIKKTLFLRNTSAFQHNKTLPYVMKMPSYHIPFGIYSQNAKKKGKEKCHDSYLEREITKSGLVLLSLSLSLSLSHAQLEATRKSKLKRSRYATKFVKMLSFFSFLYPITRFELSLLFMDGL